ncbi:hypothetical protein [Croceibacterium ferulae]|uniref:hypothetical protein n=1 Tax=Croceibacterium ferulae TaxID=1854641 RepID=UPI000EB48099|nr:hypothetical protein [Croceibacterium ferulae]
MTERLRSRARRLGALCAATVLLASAAHGQDISPRAERLPQHRGGIGVMQQGLYVCELPDPRAPSRGVVQQGTSFRITSASRYISDQGTGTYLRRGNTVVLSSGPRAGESYRIISDGFVRKVEDGAPGRLRCVRRAR